MNHYTELLNYIKELGDADSYINTVTKVGDVEFDLNKSNIFPILDIWIGNGSFSNGSTVSFDVELICVGIRDINNEVREDKFFDNDNEVDNHNETLASLNRLWTTMYRDFDNNDITASENPTFNKITLAKNNLVDGWVLSFTVELPNTTLNLCNCGS